MDAFYYIREAQRCREIAAKTLDSKSARRWHKLADDYTILAEELDAHIHHRPTAFPMRQHVQQQQSKTRK